MYANSLFLVKDFSNAIKYYLKYPEIGLDNCKYRNYNLACSFSNKKRIADCFYYLYLAIAQGFDNIDYINKDIDLDYFRRNLDSKDISRPFINDFMHENLSSSEAIKYIQFDYNIALHKREYDAIVRIYGLPYYDPYDNYEHTYLVIYNWDYDKNGYFPIVKESIKFSGIKIDNYSEKNVDKIKLSNCALMLDNE
jgi:hypothetical protein